MLSSNDKKVADVDREAAVILTNTSDLRRPQVYARCTDAQGTVPVHVLANLTHEQLLQTELRTSCTHIVSIYFITNLCLLTTVGQTRGEGS